MIGKIVALLTFGCLWPSLGVSQQVQVPMALQSPAAATPSQPAGPSPVGLEDLVLNNLVREALQKNPSIQSALHSLEAQRRRVPQAKTMPDPTVGVSWMGNSRPFSVQTGDPSSYRGVNAMQMLPYPRSEEHTSELQSEEPRVG